MKLFRRLGTFLVAVTFVAVLSSTAVAPTGCSSAGHVTADFRQCFGPDFKGDAVDVAKAVGGILLCDLASGGGALPACVISGLNQLAREIGPSGKADVACVVNLLKNQIASTKTAANRDDVVRAQRARLWLDYVTSGPDAGGRG